VSQLQPSGRSFARKCGGCRRINPPPAGVPMANSPSAERGSFGSRRDPANCGNSEPCRTELMRRWRTFDSIAFRVGLSSPIQSHGQTGSPAFHQRSNSHV
jgi:hypothetical protein